MIDRRQLHIQHSEQAAEADIETSPGHGHCTVPGPARVEPDDQVLGGNCKGRAKLVAHSPSWVVGRNAADERTREEVCHDGREADSNAGKQHSRSDRTQRTIERNDCPGVGQ